MISGNHPNILYKLISGNHPNILYKLNAGDEKESISEDELGNPLTFACDQNYLCKYTYKNNVSYRINEKDLYSVCDICSNALSPYSIIETEETKCTNETLKTHDAKINLFTVEIINILISKLTETINENCKP